NFELLDFHLYGSIRASFGVSTAATVVVPRSARLRLVVLLLRMCCLNALLRRNFPVFVRLKRLAAPRCVFSFGIVVTSQPTRTPVLLFHLSAAAGSESCASGCLPSAASTRESP